MSFFLFFYYPWSLSFIKYIHIRVQLVLFGIPGVDSDPVEREDDRVTTLLLGEEECADVLLLLVGTSEQLEVNVEEILYLVVIGDR